jgi:hypothetical protein
MAYTPLRYAFVGEQEAHGERLLPVAWVVLSRWDHDSGEVEFCVEYLDRAAEVAGEDESFKSLADAERHASERFSIEPHAWREGMPSAG